MKKATVYIVVLGIVCTGLGAATGVAIERNRIKKALPHVVRKQLLRNPKALQQLAGAHQKIRKAHGAKMVEHITKELNLTPEQQEQVKSILESAKEEVKQVQDQFKTQVQAIKEGNNERILEVLDPEQKEKFLELTAKIKERQAQKGTRRHPKRGEIK